MGQWALDHTGPDKDQKESRYFENPPPSHLLPEPNPAPQKPSNGLIFYHPTGQGPQHHHQSLKPSVSWADKGLSSRIRDSCAKMPVPSSTSSYSRV